MDLQDQRVARSPVEALRLEHPAFDVPAVSALELDALRRRDVGITEDLVVDARQTAELSVGGIADIDVTRLRRAGDESREARAAAIERCCDDVVRAMRHLTRRPWRARDRGVVHVGGPAVAGDEVDARSVACPRRLRQRHETAHVGEDHIAYGAVPGVDRVRRAACRRSHPNMVVDRVGGSRVVVSEVGEVRAVGREGGVLLWPIRRRDPRDRASYDVEHVHVAHGVAVAIVGAVRNEREARRVRRPRRLEVVPVAVGELGGPARGGVDEPEMAAPQIEETLLVALVAQPVVDAHFRLGRASRPVGLRDHDQARAVRRPRQVLHVVVENRALLLVPLAVGDEQIPRRPFLSLWHLAAIRDEGDAPAIRRPLRQQVLVLAAGELSRGATGAGHKPDR
ncbi:MAG: hypothetical protein AUH85_13205 [Chloroflexi bacterium 13_1_40CM_4_68_4]|nr:MAG: hypothetical protein AUH85_13205 [Chloroflexi bacterium 13_1_40CM_4_68_4]